MNIVDKLEEMLANRLDTFQRYGVYERGHMGDRNERLAFDALPALLAVARAARACEVECPRGRTGGDGSEYLCGFKECPQCSLLAALEDLSDHGAQLAVSEKADCMCRGPGPCCGESEGGICGCLR